MRLLISLLFVSAAPAAFASAPAGVWAEPTSISILGAEGDTPSAVIVGLFTVHTGEGSEGSQWGYAGFEPPVEGFMSVVCRPGDKDMCLLQWRDIEAAASDKACVGWGEIDLDNGTVHPMGTPSGTPEPWNLAMGVVTGVTPCRYLDEYVPGSGDVGGGDVDAGPADTAQPDTGSGDTTADAVPPPEDTMPADTESPTEDTTPTPGDSAGASDTTPSDTATNGSKGGDDGCAGGALGLGALATLALARAARRLTAGRRSTRRDG